MEAMDESRKSMIDAFNQGYQKGLASAEVEVMQDIQLRDWFAGHIIQGLLAHGDFSGPYWLAKTSFQIADEMMKVRGDVDPLEPKFVYKAGSNETKD